MSNDMESMRTFADQLWKYMVPKLDSKFASNVSYFRAQVVSNPGNNKLEVQRPVENGTLTLPCVRAMSGAQAGQQVVALVMGSMSNAIIVGDGKLNVPGGGGDAGIANFQAQPDGSLVITLTNGVTFTATPVINAFSNVQVGSTTISADNNANTLTLNAGGLVSLTGNATNDSVTIYVDPNHTHITTQVLDLVNADSYGPSYLATFDADVAEVPLKNCVVDIEPLQAGSGTPSPANVRAISGWTGAKVTRSGKNLLNFTGYNIFKREYGITFDVVTDQNGALLKIVANGTDTSTGPYYSQVYIQVPASYARHFSGKILTGGAANLNIQLENAYSPYTVFAKDSGSGATISSGITGARLVNIICRVPRGTTVSNLEIFPMIRDAGTDETYEPYQGDTINISFPTEAGTVYSGTLDVLKGTLTVDRASVTITGGLRYYQEHTNHYRFNFNALDGKAEPNSTSKLLSNIGVPISAQGFSSASVGVYIGNGNTMGALYLNKSLVSPNNESANAWVASHPVQIVYPLETPITYQLSPQIISALLGNNNIWADCGTISVDYGAFLSALDKAIEEHSEDDIRHITETDRETWDSKADSTHTHDASDITSGILPAARGGTGNGNGYIQIGQKAGTTLNSYATAEGYGNTASGAYCHSEGNNNTASGHSAHVEGNLNTASGNHSHSEGRETTASSFASHAEGLGTTASGSQSHAEGYYTNASDNSAHAEGYETTSSGFASHAEGVGTTASGDRSHAEGYHTTAAGNAQHVFGQYNTSNTTSVEIVGWGASGATKNIRTLSTAGNEWIAGTLTQASDARLKDVQGEIPDLSSIRAVRFRWKKGDDKEHLGYLAQDVEGIAPYLVDVDSNGYKSLDYIALLTAKVEMLEREIEKLKGDARNSRDK